MRRSFLSFLPVLLCLVQPVPAQKESDAVASQASLALGTSFASASGATVFGLPIEVFRRNQPLTCSLTSTGVQTLADGTRLTHTGHFNLYRDSAGRVRQESFYDSGKPMTVVLLDPVAGTVTYLMVVPKQATSMDVEANRMMRSLAARPAAAKRPAQRGETDEALPARSLDGYAAEGTRQTRTIPAGTAGVGNDKPITLVVEEWFSPQLGIDLQRTVKDPRTGDAITNVDNVQLGEPDPGLFRVPPEYKRTSN